MAEAFHALLQHPERFASGLQSAWVLVLKSHATLSGHRWKWWLSTSLTAKQSHLRGLFNPKPRREHMSTRHTPAPTQPKLFVLASLNPYWTASARECGHGIQWESWTPGIHEDSLPRVLAQSSQKTTLGDEETDRFSNKPVYKVAPKV